MIRDVEILLGPPGTGKTTRCLDYVDEALADGVDPARIAYLAFTRKAAREARERAMTRFSGLTDDDLPYFRTLHSLAFRMGGYSKQQIMSSHHFREFGASIGMTFRGYYDENWPSFEATGLGDRCLRIHALAIARQETLHDSWYRANEDQLPWETVLGFRYALEAFKRDNYLIDFTDMLEQEPSALDVDLFVLDEAQDLTPQQWRYARSLASMAERVKLAGDDDQAIYDWAGADSNQLARFVGRRTVLPVSHRLGRQVKSLADTIAQRIEFRIPKDWRPRDAESSVDWVRDVSDCDLLSGTWLLLVRHRSQIQRLVEECRRQGVVYRVDGAWSNAEEDVRAVVGYERLRRGEQVERRVAKLVSAWIVGHTFEEEEHYTWESMGLPEGKPDWMQGLTRLSQNQREYIRDVRRHGEPLTKPGRVEISTVHGAKGGEADNVFLSTDVNGRVAQLMRNNPSAEYRVAYVGATRARENLYLGQPTGQYFWTV